MATAEARDPDMAARISESAPTAADSATLRSNIQAIVDTVWQKDREAAVGTCEETAASPRSRRDNA